MERGFHGASLDEVAAVAGFTKGAVYSNFKNKEDLFLALFKANYDREMQALRTTLGDSEGPPEARISDFVSLIRDETRRGRNMGLLYQEFWLLTLRHATRPLEKSSRGSRTKRRARGSPRSSRRRGSARALSPSSQPFRRRG